MTLPVPRHLAVIMDGNGRWARRRGLLRHRGHEHGADTVRLVTRECARLGVEFLTLYAFSVENRKRPAREQDFLWKLLKKFVVQEREEIGGNRIRFRSMGRREGIPRGVLDAVDETVRMSAHNEGMTLTLTINYGGRVEIVDAARALAEKARAGEIDPSQIDEAMLSQHLYAPDMPDPDLLIRTGGDLRVSNFLLWQISYSEIWVTPKFWPDFGVEDLHEAFRDFDGRERRFGDVRPPKPLKARS